MTTLLPYLAKQYRLRFHQLNFAAVAATVYVQRGAENCRAVDVGAKLQRLREPLTLQGWRFYR